MTAAAIALVLGAAVVVLITAADPRRTRARKLQSWRPFPAVPTTSWCAKKQIG
jgi:hypothetical protein